MRFAHTLQSLKLAIKVICKSYPKILSKNERKRIKNQPFSIEVATEATEVITKA